MGKAKYDNNLYEFTKAALNQALPLEWTIRALQKATQNEYKKMELIDNKIREFWRQKNFTDSQIKDFDLMSLSWDKLQTGRNYNRSFAQVFTSSDMNQMLEGLKELQALLRDDANEINLPIIANHYRYCDLMSGNDIPRMLKKIININESIGKYSKEDSIPIGDFPFFIRTPILINKECFIMDGAEQEFQGKKFPNNLIITINTNRKIDDFEPIINEITLAYALKRKAYLELHHEEGYDDLPDKLISNVLDAEMFNVADPAIDRHDGLTSHLVGLYYWDSNQGSTITKSKIIAENLSRHFNIIRDESTIRKDFKTTRKKIEDLIYKCKLLNQ